MTLPSRLRARPLFAIGRSAYSLLRNVVAHCGHYATRATQLYPVLLTLQTHRGAAHEVLPCCMHSSGGRPSLTVTLQSYRSHFGLKKHGKEDIKKVRTLLLPSPRKCADLSPSQVSFTYVSSLLPDYPWTKARTGVLHKSNYDIVDAFLCAQFTLKRYRYAHRWGCAVTQAHTERSDCCRTRRLRRNSRRR